MAQDKHTEEHKQANKKTIKVGNQEKDLIFDNEEFELEDSQLSENDLERVVEQMVSGEMDDLNESPLYEGWLEEADYPEGFDIETFKSLPSFKKRVQYARDHLGKIGAGSARIVFGVDPFTVVKIAMNKKGLAQNEAEVDVSRRGYDITAKVDEFDGESYLYIEMERAKKLNKSDWKRLTGWSFDDWMNTLNNRMLDLTGNRGYRRMTPEDFEDIEESELFSDVVEMMMNFSMPTGDVARASSWGIVTRDGKKVPVMIDYGLTSDILEKYYL